jgi:hypothetical protein
VSYILDPSTQSWHVLVLHDGEEKDIKGIWGPYASSQIACDVLTELAEWPIDGSWSVWPLKRFQTQLAGLSAGLPTMTYRDGVTSFGSNTSNA